MAQITIHRGKHYYMGILPWRIFLDGKVVGKIGNGKDLTMDIAAGKHEMQVGSETIVHFFLYKWLHSNKLIFEAAEKEKLEFSVGYHSLWNFGYRRPEFFVSREPMVLLPVNEHSKDYHKEQEHLRALYNNVFLKNVRGSKIDLFIHSLYLAFLVALPVFFKNGVTEIYDWLGLNILLGAILFFVYRYNHHFPVFGLLSCATVLLGYDKSFPLIGIIAAVFFATFAIRFIDRYRHFKKETTLLKRKDVFLGAFSETK
ncbi:MAG: hypothetical protein QM642_10870 [Edaphocola sp.]